MEAGRLVMGGEIAVGAFHAPLWNIVAIFIGVLFALVIIFTFGAKAVKELGIKNIGPIKMEQQSQSAMYMLDREIAQLDVESFQKGRAVTDKLSRTVGNMFSSVQLCSPAKIALYQTLRAPLYASATNNHFTREFSAENFPIYRERLINEMQQEYESLAEAANNAACDRDKLLNPAEAEAKIGEIVDIWLKYIAREVSIICERKIDCYGRFLDVFIELKDEARQSIVEKCIDKNARYLDELKARMGEELVDVGAAGRSSAAAVVEKVKTRGRAKKGE